MIEKIGLLPNFLLPLLVGDLPIEILQCAKKLGITFNSQLSWTNHINTICGKTYAMLRNLYGIQYFTPFNVRMLLAKTYQIPTLLYGYELFVGLNSVSRNKLNVTYNNIARYIFGRSRFSSTSHFSYKIYCMTLESLLQYRKLIFLQKIIYLKEPDYLFTRLLFSRTNKGYGINVVRYIKQMFERYFYINTARS